MFGLELKGKVALVTGAGRGIGHRIAAMLADCGAKVVLASRTAEEIENVARGINNYGGEAVAKRTDIAEEHDVEELFSYIESENGRLDILINNAGAGVFGALVDMTVADFDHTLAANMRGTFLCSRQAMRMMMRKHCGYIINIASVVGFRGYAEQSAYSAAKHGMMGLTKSLAAEAQPHGIRVSAVLPGGVDTEMIRRSRPDLDPAELLDCTDVAQAVAYLLSLSDRASVDEIYIRRRNSKPF